MDSNSRRMLQKLWKDRHTHSDDPDLERRLIIVESRTDTIQSAGATLHLVSSSTDTVTDSGTLIQWSGVDTTNPPRNFNPSLPGEWITITEPGYYDIMALFVVDSYHGGLVVVSRKRGGVETKVWPTADAFHESFHGNKIGALAKGIELKAGDQVGVRVATNEASVDLLEASLTIEFVHHLRGIPPTPPAPEPGEWELVLETDPRFGIVFDGTNWWLTVNEKGASPALFKYDTSWNLVDSHSPFTGNRAYRGITYSDGYLYVSYDGSLSDSGHRVRRVDPSDGSTVTTGPGTGLEPLHDITVKDGDLYVRGRHANFGRAWIIDISTLERTGEVVAHEEIDGFEWDEGNECWWVSWKDLLNPVYKVYAFSEDFSTELVEIDAPERLRGVERQGDYLYAVGDSGVWRVKVV